MCAVLKSYLLAIYSLGGVQPWAQQPIQPISGLSPFKPSLVEGHLVRPGHSTAQHSTRRQQLTAGSSKE